MYSTRQAYLGRAGGADIRGELRIKRIASQSTAATADIRSSVCCAHAHNCHTTGRQDARIHVSEPDFQALTQSGALLDGRPDQGITAADFEIIIRSQLTLYVQARSRAPAHMSGG